MDDQKKDQKPESPENNQAPEATPEATPKGFDRRQLLFAGGAALAAPFALQGQSALSFGEPVTPRAYLGIDPRVDLLDRTLSLMDRAFAEGKNLYGNKELATSLWNEGRALFSTVQQDLLNQPFKLQIIDPLDGKPIDVNLRDPFPTIDQFWADEAAILKIAQQAQPGAGNLLLKILSKILAALGIGDFFNDIYELLKEDGLIDELQEAIDSGDIKRIMKVIRKILDRFLDKEFLERLGRRIGSDALKRLLAKIGARFIPIVGWALFLAELLIAILEQI